VLAGGLAAPGQRSLFPGDPGCGLSSVQGSLGSRLAAGDRRSRLGLEARGAPDVACAAGSPAYGGHAVLLPAGNTWSDGSVLAHRHGGPCRVAGWVPWSASRARSGQAKLRTRVNRWMLRFRAPDFVPGARR
jgi:hypothetical protein